MRRTLFFTALCVGAILQVTGCNSAPPPLVSPPPPTVSVARPVAHSIIDYDEYQGRTEASEFVEIRARVSGYLQQIHFADGALVDAGQVLFTIDPKPYEAEVDRAKGEVGQLEARVDRLSKDFDRTRRLFDTKSASQESFDQVAGELGEAKAGLFAAKAALQRAELDLGYTRVTSPISGRVSRHEVSQGNLISGGTSGQGTLLTTVVSVEPMYVYVDASERQVLKYQRLAIAGKRKSAREGQVAMFIGLADEKGTPHQGFIDFVDNRLDANTGTIRARGIFENDNNYLQAGYYVNVRVPGSDAYDALLVPEKSIGTQQNERFMLVLDEKNKAIYRPVQLGSVHDDLRVITSGLKGDERFVVSALTRVRPGMVVDPQEIKIDPPTTLGGQAATMEASPKERPAPVEPVQEPAKEAEKGPAAPPAAAPAQEGTGASSPGPGSG
jgi:RND family efflux transporter MFP subunit